MAWGRSGDEGGGGGGAGWGGEFCEEGRVACLEVDDLHDEREQHGMD